MKGPAIPLRRRARFVARHLGLDIHRYQPALDVDARRTRFLREHRVGVLLDGGVNTGQWVLAIRGNGYRGVIISFEPLADTFAALDVASAGDPLWRCVQAALGDADTEARMNVAGNSVSSSLLPMEPAHASAAPESAYVQTEAVRVVRLDSVVPKMVPAGSSLALKLDLQGYEAAALAGAEGILADVRLVECELSIVSLYRGQPLYLDMINLLNGLGFSLASLSEGLTDPATGHLMQVDAILRPGRRPAAWTSVTPLDMVVEAGSPHEELNERLRESEQDTFAPDRYAQFARRLRADCEVVLDVGCGMAGVARC